MPNRPRWRCCRCLLPLGLLSLGLAGCGITSKAQNAEGVRLFEQGAYPAAIQNFQSAVYNDPRNANAYYNLGAVYHRLGNANSRDTDLDQAEMYYHQCLDRNYNHVDCHRGLAVLLVEQERSEEAFELLEGWSFRSPYLADPKIELARLYEEFGEPDTAEQKLHEALAVEPNNSRALAALGRLREEAGELGQALADYQRSLWGNRFQPEVAARVAALQAQLGSSTVASAPALGPSRTVNAAPRAVNVR
jgi:tetratricopeptide (TPR) repeat protein